MIGLTHLKKVQLFDAVVHERYGAMRHLPWSVQEQEQSALAGEKVVPQIQERHLALLNQAALLIVSIPLQTEPIPASTRPTQRVQPLCGICLIENMPGF